VIRLTQPEEAVKGVVRNLSVKDYNEHPGLRQSLLKKFMEQYEGCPALYRWHVDHPDSYDSKAFTEGRAFHCKLLEPEEFRKRYRILTTQDRENIFQKAKSEALEARSKAIYAKMGSYSEWEEQNGAKGFTGLSAYKEWEGSDPRDVIPFDFARHMDGMINALRSNRDVMDELGKVKLDDMEVSLFAPYDFKDGRLMQLKCRVDMVGFGDCLLDLKTCRTTNSRRFASDVARYGYDVQSAFYLFLANLNGMNKRRFGFLAQEKEPPYLCCIHFVPEPWIKYARIRFKHALSDLAEAIRQDKWDFPITGEIEPPGYLSEEIEAVI